MPYTRDLLDRAANEIERLRAHNAALERGMAAWKEQADMLMRTLSAG